MRKGTTHLALDLEGSQAGFYNVKFYGFQDTFLINRGGSGYFKNCYIEGSVDFIWGYGTGYFQGSTIASNSEAMLLPITVILPAAQAASTLTAV
ncbi:uncharacterized protein B0P05DRAFT_553309 [Gilbertella persicaria]|uniref:uncharacterized protein n=1 Tax=Gilbertella persicaria TaxID=101096 RepID=UPI0022206E58|nr:uncharacterized protein B0P05DRAFT_553309 [Gilbertella persicaria]KAI8067029.1 hypothetical protein B0P05DRAFT_553309 [Gilbertella persicaria]